MATDNHFLYAGQEVRPQLADVFEVGTPEVVGVPLGMLSALSSVRIYMPRDLRSAESCAAGMRCLAEAVKRLQKNVGAVPELRPEEDLKVGMPTAFLMIPQLLCLGGTM